MVSDNLLIFISVVVSFSVTYVITVILGDFLLKKLESYRLNKWRQQQPRAKYTLSDFRDIIDPSMREAYKEHLRYG